MKVTVGREVLLPAFQALNGVVERRNTLPVLGNVLLLASSDGLVLSATDTEIELVIRLPVATHGSTSTTIPAKKMLDICRSLPEGAQIELNFEESKVTVRSGRSRFALGTLPADEFPSFRPSETGHEFAIPGEVLRGLIARTQFAMAHQDVRYYLNGLLLDIGSGRLRAVATDGHRLAMAEASVEGLEAPSGLQVIIPRKAVLEIAKLASGADSEALVRIGTGDLCVSVGASTISTKLIEGRFPDYERVIPRNGDKIVLAERGALRQGLSRTSILSSEKYKGIRLTLDPGAVRAFAHSPEREEAEEEIDAEYEGPHLEIGFNVSYLLDVVDAIDAQRVQLTLSDSDSSCLITAEGRNDSTYVVMPMRL